MDDLSNPAETPRADPHAGCCGGWGLITPGYPIMLQMRLFIQMLIRALGSKGGNI